MLDKIIRFSIHNKPTIGILTLVLIIWGVYNFTRLPIDAVPDITNNQVQVITPSPSLAAQEVERLITFPIEVNVRSIPGIIEVRSISRFGLSVVTIVFRDETDIYWARQQVSERLRTAAEQIPKGVGSPELAPVTTGLGEIYQYILRPKPGYEKKYPPAELRSIQDWIVRRQLLGTVGVADVSSFGGFLKQYEIAIDPDRLRNLGISDFHRPPGQQPEYGRGLHRPPARRLLHPQRGADRQLGRHRQDRHPPKPAGIARADPRRGPAVREVFGKNGLPPLAVKVGKVEVAQTPTETSEFSLKIMYIIPRIV